MSTTVDTALPPARGCDCCPGLVRWVPTAATGTTIPIDAQPHPNGNQWWLPREAVVAQLGPMAARQQRAAGMPLFRWHGVGCAVTRARTGTGRPKPAKRGNSPASAATRVSALEQIRRVLPARRRWRR